MGGGGGGRLGLISSIKRKRKCSAGREGVETEERDGDAHPLVTRAHRESKVVQALTEGQGFDHMGPETRVFLFRN